MSERIIRKGDECLYQPRLHSVRIKQLHQIAVNEQKPMTVILDTLVARGVKEYNKDMEKPLDILMEELAGAVSYFALQKVEDGWFLSFVDTELREFEGVNLKDLINEATSLVFPASSEDHSEVQESSVPPSPENQ